MWLKLANATFSVNLGQMSVLSNSISIKYNGLNGAFAINKSSVSKDDTSAELKLTLNSNWTCTTASATVTGATETSDSYSDGILTINITPSSGTTFGDSGATEIVINVTHDATSNSSGGGDSGGDPTNYTFTINPTPTSATVTLSATGYSTVSGTGSKSITVANGTTVSWSVSASGYITRTGSWTISGSNETKSVILTAENAEYVSYIGTSYFTDVGQRVQWNESNQKWTDTHSGTTSAGTELIPVSSEDSIWISKIAVVNGSLASGGFYNTSEQLVAPLFWGTFGIDQAANSSAKFVTPENPVTIASVEEEYNCSIAYVKFTAWAASADNSTGIETTEARVYYANGVPQEPTYVSYIGEDVFSFNKETFTEAGYTASGSSSAYSTDYIAITPQQGVWLQYIFTMSDAHHCVGLFDSSKTFIKSIKRADFGLELGDKFKTPAAPVKISDIAGTENVAYVRFVAWTTSDGGRENTEARIYSY